MPSDHDQSAADFDRAPNEAPDLATDFLCLAGAAAGLARLVGGGLSELCLARHFD